MDRKDGYRKLIVWRNAYKLRRMIYEITRPFAKTEIRRISQMRDSARSIKQNIQEGYPKSLRSYINHLNIALGSLGELRGDIENCSDDRLIDQGQFQNVDDLAAKTEYLLKRLIQSLVRKRDGNQE